MNGDKISNMRDAAAQFIQQMGNDDVISLVSFSTSVRVLMENQKVSAQRANAITAIKNLNANGNTALFDAVAQGAALIAKYNSPSRTNIMIVLTDGLDNSSKRKFDASLVKDATANNTSLYTVAYGGDANTEQLDSLAKQSNGTSYIGSEANISQIYQDMSAAFGGSVGIGR
jgi:Ca-activated chloride channel family protein